MFFLLEVVPFLFYAHASSKKINPPFPADKKSFHPGLELGDDNLRHHFRSFGSMLHIGRNHLSSILGDLENFCWENTKLAWNFVAIFLRIFFCGGVGWGGKRKDEKDRADLLKGRRWAKVWSDVFFFLSCFLLRHITYISSIEHGRWIESMKEKPMLIEKGHSNYWISIFSGSTVL